MKDSCPAPALQDIQTISWQVKVSVWLKNGPFMDPDGSQKMSHTFKYNIKMCHFLRLF